LEGRALQRVGLSRRNDERSRAGASASSGLEADAAAVVRGSRDGLKAAVAHAGGDAPEKGEVHRARQAAVLDREDVERAIPEADRCSIVARLEALRGQDPYEVLANRPSGAPAAPPR
jgi:hypothetical protein